MEKASAGAGRNTRQVKEASRAERKRGLAAVAPADGATEVRRSRRVKSGAEDSAATAASAKPSKPVRRKASSAASAAASAATKSPATKSKGKAKSPAAEKRKKVKKSRSQKRNAEALAESDSADPPAAAAAAASKRGSGSKRSAKRQRKVAAPVAMSADGDSSDVPPDAFAEMAAAIAASGALEGASAASEEHSEHASALQALLARVTSGASVGLDLGGFSGGGGRYRQILDDLQADDEDFRQEAALRKLTEMLLMGNEETLSGFRPDVFVPVLHTLLQADHRPQIALLACDALCNMLEAVPQSAASVAQCAPSLCAKLLSIEYIDLAERALDTIAKLAPEQGGALLKAGGLNSSLAFIDFFPIALQRSAVVTAVKMCHHVTPDKFDLCKDVVPQLSNLLQYSDRTLVEAACDCFAKLIEKLSGSPAHVMTLTEHGLVEKLLALVSTSPQLIGRGSLSVVLGMLASVLRACPVLAAGLHDAGVGNTITSLLGEAQASAERSLSREQAAGGGTRHSLTPAQLTQTMGLIHELLPPLPSTVLVSRVPKVTTLKPAVWQWRDGDYWSSYDADAAATLEAAHANGDDECELRAGSQRYTVSFASMEQVNASTGTKRRVQRVGPPREGDAAGAADAAAAAEEEDPRGIYFAAQPERLQSFCEPLIPPLFDLLLSTANPELMRTVLRVLVKMLHWGSAEGLTEALRNLAVSSYLTNILRSPQPDLVIGALQMATDLITKLPDIFAVYFRRQGVLFEMCRLAKASAKKGGKGTRSKGKSRAKSPKKVLGRGAAAAAEQQRREHVAALEAFASDAAHALLDAHFDKAVADKGPLADPHEAMDLLRRLNRLAVTIDPTQQPDPTLQRAALEEARAVLAEEDTAVSSFEIWSSNLLSAMLSYLTHPAEGPEGGSRLDRIRHFCTLFFKASTAESSLIAENEALAVLVRAVHGAINHTETFPCETLDDSDAFLQTLKTPIKLQLQPAEGTKLKHLSSNMVMIEPFASIQAIEDFLWPRVRLTPADRARMEAEAAAAKAEAAAIEAAAAAAAAASEGASKASGRKKKGSGKGKKSPKASEAKAQAKAAAASAMAAAAAMAMPELEDDSSADESGLPFGLEMAMDHDGEGEFYDDEDAMEHEDLMEGGLDSPDPNGPATAARRSGVVDLSDLGTDPEPDATSDAAAAAAAPTTDSAMEVDGAASSAEAASASGGVASSTASAGASAAADDKGRRSALAAAAASGRGRIPASLSTRRLQVLMNGHPLEQTTTIYQAIQQHQRGAEATGPAAYRHLTGRVFTVSYREYSEPKAAGVDAAAAGVAVDGEAAAGEGAHPVEARLADPPQAQGLDVDDPVHTPMMLLRALHVLNETCQQLFPNDPSYVRHLLHPDAFLNNSLASKLTRQVSDLEKICAGSFPEWCGALIQACPFIVPFECKRLFFFYTAFGSVRALVHYQDINSIPEADSGDRALPSRISRIKVKISRKRIFRSLLSMEDSMVNARSIMEIMFKDEIGTGLGPTLEFYALAARAWQEKSHSMWRDDAFNEGDVDAESVHVFAPNGLYPRPRTPGASNHRIDALFRTFGMFLARAILDGRLLDVGLNRCFMVWLRGYEANMGLPDLQFVDTKLHENLAKFAALTKQRAAILAEGLEAAEEAERLAGLTVDGCSVADLSLTFVLPGFPEVALCDGGADKDVTLENLAEYVEAVVRVTLVDGVSSQMTAVRAGFNAVFPLDALKVFSPAELGMLVSGSETVSWEVEDLRTAINADHGFTRESPQLDYLCQIMSEFDHEQQRLFLSFITGSPRLPVGGFKALRPRLTVVRKNVSKPDEELPSVMTCQNYLKLPPYSGVDICRSRILTAMTEGQGSFLLS